MAVAYGAISQPGLLSQQYGPPLLPKPGKDNVRLRKILKRTAKKKAAAQASQTATPFRSSLSPVNEASPDLEHSDHSTPPKTPEAPSSLYGIQQPPRFTVRPLYQHVPSPYPQRAGYGRAARMSPPTAAIQSYSYSQHATSYSSYTASERHSGVSASMGQVAQPVVARVSQSSSAVPEITVQATELKKPAVRSSAETNADLRSATKPTSSGPTSYSAPVVQALIRPLTVLSPLIKCKSPRPTFKATEPSKSPKPMFDVPQIRMYTATTSYYETSRTPPVYDTAGLTAIGSTVAQSKASAEPKQDLILAPEVRRSIATAAQPPTSGMDPHRMTTTSESKRGTTPTAEVNTVRISTSEIRKATSPAEIKKATPSEIKRATPTEMKRATPTSDITSMTQAPEIKSVPPTSEPQLSRTLFVRPRTPAHHTLRASTPVFEISRPNPLLFAVSPITVEAERFRTPKTISSVSSSPSSQIAKITELPEILSNGDIHSDIMPADKETQKPITKSKSEPNLISGRILGAPAGSQRSKTPSYGPPTPAVTAYQRPKTPTYEASRLMTISPGYKRPKTPTQATPAPVTSQAALPKPATQVSQKSKSAYRGLTPAEYAAYGGIKTHSPAYGISGSVTASHDDEKAEKKAPEESSKEPSVKRESTAEETYKDAGAPQQGHQKVAADLLVPIIVVSQASESLGTILTPGISSVSSKDTAALPEKPKHPTATDKQKAETQIQEVKTPEAKQPLPKDGNQDPLKAVRKLLGKDKVQIAKETAISEKKAEVSLVQEPVKPATKIKDEGPKPGFTAPAKPAEVPTTESGAAGKVLNKKEEAVSAQKKEADETPPATDALLKGMQKPKGLKSKLSGWSRLKKHMVVEQEEPTFPETDSQKQVSGGQDQDGEKMPEEKLGDEPSNKNETATKDTPKATKMWDAVLFQMFSSKENIMHQIELNKSESEMKEEKTDELKEIPSFAYRLPVLLFSPKFDAKRLKEAASRPVTKISTVFEMGLIGRKGKDEEPKDFNRTARGFAAT